jgi:hypothetical protein
MTTNLFLRLGDLLFDRDRDRDLDLDPELDLDMDRDLQTLFNKHENMYFTYGAIWIKQALVRFSKTLNSTRPLDPKKMPIYSLCKTHL